MSVTINGTSGVTTPGIANSEGYTGDGLTIAAGAPAGALQINTSGNAGLGVVPSAWSTLKSFDISSGGALFGYTSQVGLANNAYFNGSTWHYKNTDAAAFFRANALGFEWHLAPSGTAGNPITFTQAMTLDSSGNLLVGTTSALNGPARLSLSVTSGQQDAVHYKPTSNITYYPAIFINSAGTTVGFIQSTSTATAYSTSSDYRLKENVAPLTNALDKIASLKPCSFTWKADGSADRGFIAHELQEVIPQAVSGEKDAVDAEGNIQPQGVDYGKITPEIVAAIQELKARIEQLEAK